jgi:hypothetical protein
MPEENSLASNNGNNDQGANAQYTVVTGNGVSPTQVQMKSPATKDMMFVRNSYGGFQAGSVIVNGSGHDYGKDNLELEQEHSNAVTRKGKPIRVKRPEYGQWGTTEVAEDAALGRQFHLHGYGSQYGEWKQQYERVVNYNQVIWYVYNPVTDHEDDPPSTSLPHTHDTMTITNIDIPPQMRGMPMIIKFGFHGSVVVTKVTWVADNGHRIVLPAGNSYGLPGFGLVRGGVLNSGSCSYTFTFFNGFHFVTETRTNVLYSARTFGGINCPSDYGALTNWYTKGNTPSPTEKAIDPATIPAHDYTAHFGNRLYWYEWFTQDDPITNQSEFPSQKVVSNLSDEDVNYDDAHLSDTYTLLPDKEYYGGRPFLWYDRLDYFLPPPPFKNPDGGFFTKASLEVEIDFNYGPNRPHAVPQYTPVYFSPAFYNFNDAVSGGCIRNSNRTLFQATWDIMNAGEGWRLGFGGWAKGAWVGGWITNFDSDTGPDKSQDFLYEMKPCELPPTYTGEGSSYVTTYIP